MASVLKLGVGTQPTPRVVLLLVKTARQQEHGIVSEHSGPYSHCLIFVSDHAEYPTSAVSPHPRLALCRRCLHFVRMLFELLCIKATYVHVLQFSMESTSSPNGDFGVQIGALGFWYATPYHSTGHHVDRIAMWMNARFTVAFHHFFRSSSASWPYSHAWPLEHVLWLARPLDDTAVVR